MLVTVLPVYEKVHVLCSRVECSGDVPWGQLAGEAIPFLDSLADFYSTMSADHQVGKVNSPSEMGFSTSYSNFLLGAIYVEL